MSQQLQGGSANLLGGAVMMLQSLIENLQGHLLHPSPHISKAVGSRILGSYMEVATQDALQNSQSIFLHQTESGRLELWNNDGSFMIVMLWRSQDLR